MEGRLHLRFRGLIFDWAKFHGMLRGKLVVQPKIEPTRADARNRNQKRVIIIVFNFVVSLGLLIIIFIIITIC